MLVQHILSGKQGGVETITSDASVNEATKVLSRRKIGALIVSDDEGKSIRGILSERDIVREVGARGAAALSDSVMDIMTAKVQSCKTDDNAVEVLARMTSGRFRHMPVLDGEALIGVVSIGDVVKARLGEVENENSALADMIRGY
ncbi:CBS domain-containing protein [Roseobacter sp. HKCCA0434]|uniref:CBS domain-containing protein n=1 Tax=Roseobacter sp. HKCCA0434 TaxID=3079297 RepID=UPI002905ED1C|nr:CBS domain-containing protein [Roseobacter sp. HKCCA0434]